MSEFPDVMPIADPDELVELPPEHRTLLVHAGEHYQTLAVSKNVTDHLDTKVRRLSDDTVWIFRTAVGVPAFPPVLGLPFPAALEA